MAIPKIIHQIYWDFKGKNRSAPKEWKENSLTFRKLHPTWEYKCWNEHDILRLIRKHYSWFLETWLEFENVEKCDSGRYAILHRYGGVYTDMDTKCLKPLDPLLDKGKIILTKVGKILDNCVIM